MLINKIESKRVILNNILPLLKALSNQGIKHRHLNQVIAQKC